MRHETHGCMPALLLVNSISHGYRIFVGHVVEIMCSSQLTKLVNDVRQVTCDVGCQTKKRF